MVVMAKSGCLFGNDFKGESLEEGHCILSLDLLENHSEFVLGNLVDEVTAELNSDRVSGEDWREGVPLCSKETESIALHDKRVVKDGFH